MRHSHIILLSRACLAQSHSVWVAAGGCPPAAPAVPYVRALAHTVPHLMDSLAVGGQNGSQPLPARDTSPAVD